MQKFKILLLLILVVIFVFSFNETFARYVSSANGSVNMTVAKWKILVSDTDITMNNSSSLTFTPTIIDNNNVASQMVAPTSKGYFDILIDASNVSTSFEYTINFTYADDNDIEDLVITSYAITDEDSLSDNIEPTKVEYSGNGISEVMSFNKNQNDFSFAPFIVRVYFEWIDDGGNMDDASDTVIGYKAANGEDINYDINASIAFRQHL